MDVLFALFDEVRAEIVESVGGPNAQPFATGLEALAHAGTDAASLPASDGQGQLGVVEAWLGPALDAAPQRRLTALLGDAAERLVWQRAYADLPPSPLLDSFRDHYAYCVLAGPSGEHSSPAIEVPGVLVGFTIQAPQISYPHHHHDPAELYGIVSGDFRWGVDQAIETVSPGDAIAHRPGESHSMRTLTQPGLTWVFWPVGLGADVWMPVVQPDAPAPTTYPDRGRLAFI